MKKIHIFLSIILFLLLVSCSKSQVDAEFKYLDENQVEQVYYIKKTEDPEQRSEEHTSELQSQR